MADTAIEYFGKTDLVFLVNLIYAEVNKYVKKVEGKDLSEEDFTTALKTKLDGIDLSLYSTTEQMNSAISAAVAAVSGMEFKKVDVLPETGEKGIIYLVPKTKTGTSDIYDEYYWSTADNKFELLGSTAVDLSDYLKIADIKEMTTAEVQAVWDSVFTS